MKLVSRDCLDSGEYTPEVQSEHLWRFSRYLYTACMQNSNLDLKCDANADARASTIARTIFQIVEIKIIITGIYASPIQVKFICKLIHSWRELEYLKSTSNTENQLFLQLFIEEHDLALDNIYISERWTSKQNTWK